MIPSDTIQLKGVPLSPGFGSGKAHVIIPSQRVSAPGTPIDESQIDHEQERIRRAFDDVIEDLSESIQHVKKIMDDSFADIFKAQISMLTDRVLLAEIEKMLVEKLYNAEKVVEIVFHRFERNIKRSEYSIVRQRSDDIMDLAKRILDKLTGRNTDAFAQIPPDTILITKRILPSDAVILAKNRINALVLEIGGPASHAAILTREIGIPAVSEISEATQIIFNDARILVDGNLGDVVINPNGLQEEEFKGRKRTFDLIVKNAKENCLLKASTIDGTRIPVMANIGDRNDAVTAFNNGADGIGLYRIERIYLSAKKMPDENELDEKIRETLQPVKELPINIRLLDTGGDKRIPFLRYPNEPNPALGLRGIRFLLKYDYILECQLKVLLRLSREFRINILVPMITFIDDLHTTKTIIGKLADELQITRLPKMGAMIETPAAALCASQIAEYADFLSLGTNDLTQYTMATGRENNMVFDYYKESHPAMMQLLKMVVEKASDRPIEICGELASHLESIPQLLKIGIRILSVAPFQIPVVKEKIRSVRLNRRNGSETT
ncbi:MAG: phosphoenolpyruvate--protein phosphotransferase [Chitinispirillaceae bacterium]|nr:phosphoenolpyruvate--protein phosphotransferase [Chitinispirillaceae bacterium]